MLEMIEAILRDFDADAAGVSDPAAVEELRVKYLGRNGRVTTLRKEIDFSKLSGEEKKAFGQGFNQLKQQVETKLQALLSGAAAGSAEAVVKDFDITLPPPPEMSGSLHPISQTQFELEDVFVSMGFDVLDGFEVEEDFYNFEALNMPPDHPAREMQDTYWLKNGRVMRTHTSACQVRALEQLGAPMRAIFPGRCFRYETIDASHDNTFYQLEGLMVDKDISVANLVAVMKATLSEIFHRDVTVRLRPGFFPFVEPGFELDVQCLICDGAGCGTCKQTGWIELMPCGLVHPNVLRYGGLDPEEWTGFAFGLGLTRMAMMRYRIGDIRVMNSGDLRSVSQFPIMQ